MPGSYTLLGLLAVAVCISFAEGAAFPSILKDESSANELHESNSDRHLIAEQHNIPEARNLNENSKHASLSEAEDEQNADIIVGRNAAYNNRASGFGEVSNLRTAGENALRRQAAAEDRSGNINDQSTGDGELVPRGGSTESQESYSSSSGESEDKNNESPSDTSGLGSAVSESEENCEDDKETGHSAVSTSATTTSSTSQATEQSSDSDTDQHTSPSPPEKASEDDCDDTEPTEPTETASEGTENSDSSSESEEPEEPQNEECEETEEPSDTVTSTTSTKSTTSPTTKKPRTRPNEDGSSGGKFEDSDESGLEFSESASAISNGDSTDLSSFD